MTTQTIRARGFLASAVRAFFTEKDYLEVETPLLAPALIPEAAIEVFKTRFEHPYRPARDLYLTPSPELWMKRLLAAGLGNMFQLCKAFRNAESLGGLHNPEFTILEYYTVDADYMDCLAFTEELFSCLLHACAGKPAFGARPAAPSRAQPPFRRMSMAEAFWEYAGLDLEEFAPRDDEEAPRAAEALSARARAAGLPAGEAGSWEEAFQRIFVGRVEPALPRDRPLALLDYPRGVRCLARDIPGTPWNERWELYVDGIETANCFTEETEPQKLAAYFREQAARKEKALVPHAIDEEFPALYKNARGAGPGRARDYGTFSGVALGFDRLLMAFCGEASIGGVILFPFSDIIGGLNSLRNIEDQKDIHK
jgi:lysyl-tRNA synthetase class 2